MVSPLIKAADSSSFFFLDDDVLAESISYQDFFVDTYFSRLSGIIDNI